MCQIIMTYFEFRLNSLEETDRPAYQCIFNLLHTKTIFETLKLWCKSCILLCCNGAEVL